MDKKFLEEKGLLKEAKRFNYIMEYISGNNNIEEVDGNGDGLDDATGAVDPMAGGAMALAKGIRKKASEENLRISFRSGRRGWIPSMPKASEMRSFSG